METLLFFIIVGYAFHFIKTQQDERYEQKSYKFFKDLFSSSKPSKTPHLDYISRETDTLPPNKDKDDYSTLSDFLEKLSIKSEYKFLQNQKHTYFKTEEWETIKDRILKRDHYQCQLCLDGIPNTILDIHHKTYKDLFKEKDEQLVTLCQSCHTRLHQKLYYPSKDNSIMYKQYFWSEDFQKILNNNKLSNESINSFVNNLT